MDEKIQVPIIAPIEISCTVSQCTCRRIVNGTLLNNGSYAAPDDEPVCPECGHPNGEHKLIGPAKSRSEKA
jgi:hypothetical protein